MDNNLQLIGIKVFIPICALFLLASTACADEMKIKLKSGNTVKISYTGQIHGVEIIEGDDSIKNMQSTVSNPAPVTAVQAQETVTQQPPAEKSLRIKMAPPKFGDE